MVDFLNLFIRCERVRNFTSRLKTISPHTTKKGCTKSAAEVNAEKTNADANALRKAEDRWPRIFFQGCPGRGGGDGIS